MSKQTARALSALVIVATAAVSVVCLAVWPVVAAAGFLCLLLVRLAYGKRVVIELPADPETTAAQARPQSAPTPDSPAALGTMVPAVVAQPPAPPPPSFCAPDAPTRASFGFEDWEQDKREGPSWSLEEELATTVSIATLTPAEGSWPRRGRQQQKVIRELMRELSSAEHEKEMAQLALQAQLTEQARQESLLSDAMHQLCEQSKQSLAQIYTLSERCKTLTKERDEERAHHATLRQEFEHTERLLQLTRKGHDHLAQRGVASHRKRGELEEQLRTAQTLLAEQSDELSHWQRRYQALKSQAESRLEALAEAAHVSAQRADEAWQANRERERALDLAAHFERLRTYDNSPGEPD